MVVKSKQYGNIAASNDTILSLIVMLQEAREHYKEKHCFALADDTQKLIDEMREVYYKDEPFYI